MSAVPLISELPENAVTERANATVSVSRHQTAIIKAELEIMSASDDGEVVNDVDLPVVRILCIAEPKNRRIERDQIKLSERHAGSVVSAEQHRLVNRDGAAEIVERVIESAATVYKIGVA